MISIRRTPHAEMAAAHNRVAHLLADEPYRPEAVNIGTVLQLGEPEPLVWDGVTYATRPLPYRAGLRLIEIRERVNQLAPQIGDDAEARATFGRTLDEAVELFASLLADRPAENPFADATTEEVGQLLGFFWRRVMMSPAPSLSRMGRHERSIC